MGQSQYMYDSSLRRPKITKFSFHLAKKSITIDILLLGVKCCGDSEAGLFYEYCFPFVFEIFLTEIDLWCSISTSYDHVTEL